MIKEKDIAFELVNKEEISNISPSLYKVLQDEEEKVLRKTFSGEDSEEIPEQEISSSDLKKLIASCCYVRSRQICPVDTLLP